MLISILNTLALVWLRFLQGADFRSNLSDLLLVNTADDDSHLVVGDVDALWGFVFDWVAKSKRHIKLIVA